MREIPRDDQKREADKYTVRPQFMARAGKKKSALPDSLLLPEPAIKLAPGVGPAQTDIIQQMRIQMFQGLAGLTAFLPFRDQNHHAKGCNA
jgi:hypothetical protein